MSVHPVLMGPMFAFGSVPYADVHDNSTNHYANQAEQASTCRRLAARKRKEDEAAAKQYKAGLKRAQLKRRDNIVAAQMPCLYASLDKAVKTRIQDHTRYLRYRAMQELAAQDTGYTDSCFEPLYCEICCDEMARTKTLPCGGRHQFCERCITIYMENSEQLACPICQEDIAEWYVARRAKVCKKEVKKFQKKVKKAIKAAEREVGIERKWYGPAVSREEVQEAVDAHAFAVSMEGQL